MFPLMEVTAVHNVFNMFINGSGLSSESVQCFLYWRWPQSVTCSIRPPMKVALVQNVQCPSLNVTSFQTVLNVHPAPKNTTLYCPHFNILPSVFCNCAYLILIWLILHVTVRNMFLKNPHNPESKIPKILDYAGQDLRVLLRHFIEHSLQKFFEEASLTLDCYRQILYFHFHTYINFSE